MKSSLTFQVSLHLGSYLLGAFALAELAMMFYKYIVLPMPFGNILIELFILFCLMSCEALRIFFAWKGNLTEGAGSCGLSALMLAPGVLGVVFFLVWQTYVLRLEVILCCLVLATQAFHGIFTFICMVTFYSSSM